MEVTPVGITRPSTLAVALALGIVYVVWGSTYLAIAYVVETLPPMLSAGARWALAGGLTLGFLAARDQPRRTRDAPVAEPLERPLAIHWRSAFIIGGLLLLGGNGLLMMAERTVPSGIAAVIIATVPIFMSLFEAIRIRQLPTPLELGGLVIGLTGVALLVLPGTGIDAVDPVGVGLLLIATVSWAAGALYARHGTLPRNQLLGVGMQQLAGGSLLFIAGLALGEMGRTNFAAVSTASVLALAYLVVFGSLVGFTAYLWLLRHVSVTTVSTTAYVNPVVAVALGTIFRDETLSGRAFFAALLVILGVIAMISGRSLKREHSDPSQAA